VWTAEKETEKLRYMHRNPGPPAHELCALGWKPVTRGLVAKPEDWKWSSFLHYATGCSRAACDSEHWIHTKGERIHDLIAAPQSIEPLKFGIGILNFL
jgi:hypothetical protein